MTIRYNNKVIAGSDHNANCLFDSKWSDHILNHMSWLRADTFSWQNGVAYSSAYNHLVSDINGKTLQSETIGSITIQYYLADDGHKICPANQETNLATLYSTIGVAWYYIIDTTNTQFKLPRTKWGFTGYRDEVGGYVSESLPNITGKWVVGKWGDALIEASGAIYNAGGSNNTTSGGAISGNTGLGFDASRSSSIYGNSTTVQPPAYIVNIWRRTA